MSAWLRSRLLPAVCVVAGVCATAASPAVASFGIHSFEASYSEAPLAGAEAEAVGPPDFQAGSHPYQFTAKVAFNTKTNAEGEPVVDGYAKDVQIKLPRGVVGNLNGIPQCPQTTFMSYGIFGGGKKCPADSQVGVISLSGKKHPLFNLTPPVGVTGELGTVVFLAPVVVELVIRNDSDYGLTADIHNISQVEEAKELAMSLWGVPADSHHDHLRCLEREGEEEATSSCPSGAAHEALLTMPSSCGEPLTTTAVAQSWEEPNTSAESSTSATNASGAVSDLSGCERLHFDPSVAVQPESSTADTATGLSVDVHVPFRGAPTELAEANLENLVVALPEGMSINSATAGGLAGCTSSQIALGEETKPTCPDESKIGTLELQTPMLTKPLRGFVYLAQPAGGLFDGTVEIYLAGQEEGLDFKLVGQLVAQSGSGQLTLTLDGMPEVPLSDLKLDLFGGPRGAIANPPVCQAFTTVTDLTPYSTVQATARSNGFTIDEGCGGGFAPAFKAGATTAAAGRETGFAFQVSRSDGQQYIQTLTTALPAGVMANISGVPQCGDAEAAAGTCSASSEIGTIAVGSGAGADPFYLNGRVYLTGPYAGAPFGISIVIPAQAGPFDLGTVLVRGKITVDLATASLTIATDAFPTILQGIPLRVKSMDLAIDRPGFMTNPTSCKGQAIDGTVGSVAGTNAAVSAPFQAFGCSGLPFAPTLAAATLGKASSRGNGASFNVKVTDSPGARAHLKSVVIKLPKPLKPRLSAVQQACLASTFTVNPQACPALSVVGNAAVDTPVLSTPLTGPAYMVFYRGSKYPDLVTVLHGSGLELQLKGAVEVNKGISTTTFNALPDIPMSLFELDLPEGSHSLLGATENLCAKSRTMGDALAGQNGAGSESSVKVAVEGCPSHAAKASKRRANASKRRKTKAAAARRLARAGRRGSR
jgi:hypothetical protein